MAKEVFATRTQRRGLSCILIQGHFKYLSPLTTDHLDSMDIVLYCSSV